MSFFIIYFNSLCDSFGKRDNRGLPVASAARPSEAKKNGAVAGPEKSPIDSVAVGLSAHWAAQVDFNPSVNRPLGNTNVPSCNSYTPKEYLNSTYNRKNTLPIRFTKVPRESELPSFETGKRNDRQASCGRGQRRTNRVPTSRSSDSIVRSPLIERAAARAIGSPSPAPETPSADSARQ